MFLSLCETNPVLKAGSNMHLGYGYWKQKLQIIGQIWYMTPPEKKADVLHQYCRRLHLSAFLSWDCGLA